LGKFVAQSSISPINQANMRYTATTLKKIEEVFQEIGYSLRYEKGSFQSGYCLVENKKIAVVNRFLDTEARINALCEILMGIDFTDITLSEASADMMQKVQTRKTEQAE
jgi:hypothetical protein